MKDLKTILERKDDTIVTLPKWAEFISIDLEKNQIEFLEGKEVSTDIKEKAGGIGMSTVGHDDLIYVCVV